MPLPNIDPKVLRALVLMGGYGLQRAGAHHVESQAMQAEVMNQALREFQAMRMAETIGNLKLGMVQRLGGAQARSDLEKEAGLARIRRLSESIMKNPARAGALEAPVMAAAGKNVRRFMKGGDPLGYWAGRGGQHHQEWVQKLEQTAGSMGKEAFIGGLVGGLGSAAGGALRGVGKAMTAVGKSGNTFRFQQAAQRLGVGATEAAPKMPGILSSGTQRFQAVAQNLGLGGAPAAAGGWRNALRARGARLQQAGKQVSGGTAKFQHNATLGSPGKPLIGGMTQAKLLGVGALAGVGYLGMKGLQATRDFMMQPRHGGDIYGAGSPGIRQGVNEFGY